MNTLSADSVIKTRKISPVIPELHDTKAVQIMACYSEATGVPAFILEQAGKKESDLQERLHHDAILSSQRTEKALIYNCPLGNTYWTSPLFRKGCYTGSLVAGKIPPNAEKNPEKIRAMAHLLELCAAEISGKEEIPGAMLRCIIRRENYQEKNNKVKKIKEPFSAPEKTVPRHYINTDYLMEKERLLLAAFRRGDIKTGKKILKEYLNFMASSVTNDLVITRLRAIELVVLMSRTAARDGRNSGELLKNNNRYIKRLQETGSLEEIAANMNTITEQMAADVFSFHGVRHSSVLRRAERFIWDNYTRKISLEEIAAYSGLSAPYFSTIFKEEMGENLSSYLNRLRVEKASNLLMTTGKTLSEISEICGFEDQSWFSKIFKKYNGISPGKFRDKGGSYLEQIKKGGKI